MAKGSNSFIQPTNIESYSTPSTWCLVDTKDTVVSKTGVVPTLIGLCGDREYIDQEIKIYIFIDNAKGYKQN